MPPGALALLLARLAAGAPVTFPAVLEASAGVHSLSIGHVAFGAYGFSTRGFNGGIPGPTFRMKPGESLRIDFTNNLVAANNVACTATAGEFCESATSNLHTHGLHVSSKGKEDGLTHYSDDVFADVQPGETETYSFTIPENHMGGTHWYHPHHHHATAIQAGGGAAGVLIVDDPEGFLPTEYSSMPEHVLFISGHNLASLSDIAQSAQSTILEGALNVANTADLATNVFFVNGQALPTLTLESHTWSRLRMAYAAVEQGLQLQVTGDATCTLKLLAKDGIYLTDLPRDITTVILFPGARADVAISCTCATYPCTGMLASNANRRLQRPGGRGRGGGPGPNDMVAADLLELSVTAGPSATVVTLPPTSVQRPCYLVDLRSVTVPNGQSRRLSLNGGARSVTVDGQGQSMTYANVHRNGGTMASWPALTSFPVGSVHELVVTGVGAHPLHLHVIPFQIIAMPADEYHDGYFRVGDWHDTLMIMQMGGGGQVTVRQQTDKFTGKMVVHCHILEHEDEGMMGFIDIVGIEGTTYADASTLDSTCYAGAFASTSVQDSTTPSATLDTTETPSTIPDSTTPSATPDTDTTAEPSTTPAPAAAAELTYPEVLEASAGVHLLEMGPVPFGNYGFNTRGFNGGVPGPTFRMKPGETLRVQVRNNLSTANNVPCTATQGEFCESATTNLHTHGLHVSSKGKEDGLEYYSDDVFADILPGETEEFRFTIPENHMGGTHWYHPHHHHATALQAGGGAAGVLIVDDPPGYLPPEYSDMPEKILFISGHNLASLANIAASAQSTLLEGAATAATGAGLATNIFFANGQVRPVLTLGSHTWHRIRMAYAAVEQGLQLRVVGDATCAMKLLAKDGVYLPDMPRDITSVLLFPGARADVAISCTCATYPCSATLGSTARRRLQEQAPGGKPGPGAGKPGPGAGKPGPGAGKPGPGAGKPGPGAGKPGPAPDDMVAADVLDLTIQAGASTSVVTLPAAPVQRPCYLVDLRSATVPSGQSKTLELAGGARTVRLDGQGQSMTHANVHANGGSMATWSALTSYAVGSIHELTVTGAARHPLHLHVIPFQITAMPAGEYYDGYFRVGDWHDTLMIRTMGPNDQVTVRQQTDKFTGKMVVHCHILEHEDEGMMGFIDIVGTEGTTYADASKLDSTCYAGAFASTYVQASTTDPPTQDVTSDSHTQDPATEGLTQEPTTDVPAEDPATDALTHAPSTDGPAEDPATDALTHAPSTNGPVEDPATEAPTQEPTTIVSAEDPVAEVFTPEPSTDAPAQDLGADPLTQDPDPVSELPRDFVSAANSAAMVLHASMSMAAGLIVLGRLACL